MDNAMAVALTGLVTVVATHFLRTRWERRRRADEVAAAAGGAIYAALSNLERLVRKARDDGAATGDVACAWVAAAGVLGENAHRLSAGWGHLRRSVRAALGEHLGTPAWADLEKDAAREPRGSFSSEWWDNCVQHLGYVGYQVGRWHDCPERGQSLAPLDFDEWLRATDRYASAC
jgi:hypothetical protein